MWFLWKTKSISSSKPDEQLYSAGQNLLHLVVFLKLIWLLIFIQWKKMVLFSTWLLRHFSAVADFLYFEGRIGTVLFPVTQAPVFPSPCCLYFCFIISFTSRKQRKEKGGKEKKIEQHCSPSSSPKWSLFIRPIRKF